MATAAQATATIVSLRGSVAGRIMEANGVYHASDTERRHEADSATDNVRPFPPRTFTQVDNTYYDRVLGKISATAWVCLSVFHRQALGYHRTDVQASLTGLEKASGLSRNTVLKALTELESCHLIATNANERGRTQVRTYTLLPEDQWTLLQSSTSAKSALVETGVENELVVLTSAERELDNHKTSADFALVDEKLVQNLNPYRNKEREINPEEIRTEQIDANASSGADKPPVAHEPVKEPKSAKTPRVLSEDHQWRVDLLALIKAANGGVTPGTQKVEWVAAGKLYNWQTGRPNHEDVVDCYTLTRASPAYDTKELTLNDLVTGRRHFAAYQRSGRDAYRKGMERSRRAANDEFGQQRGNGNAQSSGTSAARGTAPYRGVRQPQSDRSAYARRAEQTAARQQQAAANISGDSA